MAMIVFPVDLPIVKDLNSYYLNIERFVEHYQGFLAAGAISFAAPSAAGVILFDEYRFLNAWYSDKSDNLVGAKAFTKLLQISSQKNFNVAVYEVDSDTIYYWAHTCDTNQLYNDLKSEFTDINTMLGKMKTEKLTGFLEVGIESTGKSGQIFFNNGMIIGSRGMGSDQVKQNPSALKDLVDNANESICVFSVYQVNVANKFEEIVFTSGSAKMVATPAAAAQPPAAPKAEPLKQVQSAQAAQPSAQPRQNQAYYIEMLQLLIQMLEKIIKANKKIKVDFDTLLKKTFVDKVDKYDFLDPFAAELTYENGRLKFYGRTSDKILVAGIVECVLDLAESTGVHGVLIKNMSPWIKKYGNDLTRLNIKL